MGEEEGGHKRRHVNPFASLPSFPSAAGINITILPEAKRVRSESENIGTSLPLSCPGDIIYESRQGDEEIFHMDFCLPNSEVPRISGYDGHRVVGWSQLSNDNYLAGSNDEPPVIRYFNQQNSEMEMVEFPLLQRGKEEISSLGEFVQLEDVVEGENSSLSRLSKPRFQAPTDPNDVNGWLAFVEGQKESSFAPSVIQERQVAILQRALESNPESLPLVWKYLQICGEKSMASEILPIWLLVRNHFKDNLEVQDKFLGKFQSLFDFFTIEDYISFVTLILNACHKNTNSLDHPIACKILIEALQLMTMSGYLQAALSCILGSKQADFDEFLTTYTSSPQPPLGDMLKDELLAFLHPKEVFEYGALEELCQVLIDGRHDYFLYCLFAILDVAGFYFGRNPEWGLDLSCPSYASLHAPQDGIVFTWKEPWIISKDDNYAVRPNLLISPVAMLHINIVVGLLVLLKKRTPRNPVLLSRLVQLYDIASAQHGGIGLGKEICKHLLMQQPDNFTLWLDYVMLLRWKNQDNEAQKVMLKLLKFPQLNNEGLAQLLLGYAQLQVRQGQTDNVLAFVMKSMGIEGSGPASLLRLRCALDGCEAFQPLKDFLWNQKDMAIDKRDYHSSALLDAKSQLNYLKKFPEHSLIKDVLTAYFNFIDQTTSRLASRMDENKIDWISRDLNELVRAIPYAKHAIIQALLALRNHSILDQKRIQDESLKVIKILDSKRCFINYFWWE